MVNQLVTRPMILRDHERSSGDPQYAWVQYRENSWKCYL